MALGSKLFHELILDVVGECFSDVIDQAILQEMLQAEMPPRNERDPDYQAPSVAYNDVTANIFSLTAFLDPYFVSYQDPYQQFISELINFLNKKLENKDRPIQENQGMKKQIAEIIHEFIINKAKECLWIPEDKRPDRQVGVLEHWIGFMKNQDARDAAQSLEPFDEKRAAMEVAGTLDERFPEPCVPLTRIDMIRYARYFCDSYINRGNQKINNNQVDVFSLNELELQGCLRDKWERHNQAIVIDLNKNKNKTAKWAVLLQGDDENEIICYCEPQLLESEKKILEDLSNKNKNKSIKIKYLGQTCSSEDCQTSGYAVAAFLRTQLFLEREEKALRPIFSFNENYNFFSFLQQYFHVHDKQAKLFWNKKFNIWGHVCRVASVGQKYTSEKGETIEIKRGDFGQAYRIVKNLKPHIPKNEDLMDTDFGILARPFVISPHNMESILREAKAYQTKEDGKSSEALLKIEPKIYYEDGKALFKRSHHKITSFPELIVAVAAEHGGAKLNDYRYDLCEREYSNSELNQEALARATVETLLVGFFGISAKNKVLTIEFTADLEEEFKLSDFGKNCILDMLSDNPYVTELNILGQDDWKIIRRSGLQEVRQKNKSNFARNKWLHLNGYKPPLRADYWSECAKYSLLYLLESPLKLKAGFEICHEEMGIKWLGSLLSFLMSPKNKEWIEKIFDEKKANFYFKPQDSESKESLRMLTEHLRVAKKTSHAFPFSEMDFHCSEEYGQQEMLDFMIQLKDMEGFEKLVILNVLQPAEKKKKKLLILNQLFKDTLAKGEAFQFIVSIPELDEMIENMKDPRKGITLDQDDLGIFHLCNAFNNLVLKKKREELVSKEIHHVEEKNSEKKKKDEEKFIGIERSLPDSKEETETVSHEEFLIDFDFGNQEPINKQIHQDIQQNVQQNLQQQVQIKQAVRQQRIVQYHEKALPDLVTYDNITDMLPDEAKTIENNGEKNTLQHFFEEWISSDHDVKAPHVISKMTIAAAQKLFQNRNMLHSGLNPDNLPKGFFIQRDKENACVLCYDAVAVENHQENVFTLHLDEKSPTAENWGGDFRQFKLDRGEEKGGAEPVLSELKSEDWEDLMLFQSLQPHPCGEEGIQAVFGPPSDKSIAFRAQLDSSSHQKINELYKKIGLSCEESLKDIFDVFKLYETSSAENKSSLTVAWGQVYHQFGRRGLLKIIEILSILKNNRNLLASIVPAITSLKDWSVLLDSDYKKCFDEIASLSDKKLKVWGRVVEQHFKSCDGWSSSRSLLELWNAFQALASKLDECEHDWTGEEFSDLNGNMIVFMDRIYFMMDARPQEKDFLLGSGQKKLTSQDLKHAGLYYVMRHESFKTLSDGDLELNGKPPHAPTDYPKNALEKKRALALRFEAEDYFVFKEYFKEYFEWEKPISENGESYLLVTEFLTLQNPILEEKEYKEYQQRLNLEEKEKDFNFCLAIEVEHGKSKEFIEQVKSMEPELKKKMSAYFKELLESNHNFRPLKVKLETINQLSETRQDEVPLVLSENLVPTSSEEKEVAHSSNKNADKSALISFMMVHDKKGVLLSLMETWFAQMTGMDRADTEKFLKIFSFIKNQYPTKVRDELLRDQFVTEVIKFIALFGAGDRGAYYFSALIRDVKGNPELQYAITNKIFPMLASFDPASSKGGQHAKALWNALDEYRSNFRRNKNDRGLANTFFQALTDAGMRSTYSSKKKLRRITDDETQKIREKSKGVLGVNYAQKLSDFIQKHFVVPSDDDEKAEVEADHFILFFKQLSVNQTEIDEVVPLLAYFGTFNDDSSYWSMSYWNELIDILKPEDEDRLFPISLLTTLLKESPFKAVENFDDAPDKISDDWKSLLKKITNSNQFDREEQNIFCQIALKNSSNLERVRQIMAVFERPEWRDSKKVALNILMQCNESQTSETFEFIQQIYAMSVPNNVEVQRFFKGKENDLLRRWLNQFSENEKEYEVFFEILNKISDDSNRSLIFYIMTYAEPEKNNQKKNEKSKTIHALAALDFNGLKKIAALYEGRPQPTLKDLRNICTKNKILDSKEEKDEKNEGEDLDQKIETFKRKPFSEPRPDHAGSSFYWSPVRDADLHRIINNYSISSAGDWKKALDDGQYKRVEEAFYDLKLLEAGKEKINNQVVSNMTPEELKEAFEELGAKCKDKSAIVLEKMQLLAVLFEGLYRTTGKYPNLAQQIAFISFIILDDQGAVNRLLQLATGEGKSHFLALRATVYAAMDYKVHINMAKQSLKERDFEEYRHYFEFFGLKVGFITCETTGKTYREKQIFYSTPAELSLAMDQAILNDDPIIVEHEKTVGLFDEVDFIYEEGLRTQFNYSQSTGRTAKQMKWFYYAVLDFYKNNKKEILEAFAKENIKVNPNLAQKIIQNLEDELKIKSGSDSRRKALLKKITKTMLAHQLKAAHQAHLLQKGRDFTVREEEKKVGEEVYKLKIIVPLSSDNQPQRGSTYSNGVHQNLAALSNQKSCDENGFEDFDIPPESVIISSQTTSNRMRLYCIKEGVSASMTETETQNVFEEPTLVLHAVTNWSVRREEKIHFVDDEQDQERNVVETMRQLIQEKKSVLFACNDDNEVKKIKEIIVRSEFQEDNFLFYTNASEKTPAEVLKEKKIKENKNAKGEKNPICLVASGFGRGDNPEVDAVIIITFRNASDRLQKTGRTARIGGKGEVFEFYLKSQCEDFDQKKTNEENLKSMIEKSEGKLGHRGDSFLLHEMLAQFSSFALQKCSPKNEGAGNQDEKYQADKESLVHRTGAMQAKIQRAWEQNKGDENAFIDACEKLISSEFEATFQFYSPKEKTTEKPIVESAPNQSCDPGKSIEWHAQNKNDEQLRTLLADLKDEDCRRQLEDIFSCVKEDLNDNFEKNFELLQVFYDMISDIGRNPQSKEIIFKMVQKTKGAWNYSNGEKREAIIGFVRAFHGSFYKTKNKKIESYSAMLEWSLYLPGRTQWTRIGQMVLACEPEFLAQQEDAVKNAHNIEGDGKKLNFKKNHFMECFFECLQKINQKFDLKNEKLIVLFGFLGKFLNEQECRQLFELFKGIDSNRSEELLTKVEKTVACLLKENGASPEKSVALWQEILKDKKTAEKFFKWDLSFLFYAPDFSNLSLEIFKLSSYFEAQDIVIRISRYYKNIWHLSDDKKVTLFKNFTTAITRRFQGKEKDLPDFQDWQLEAWELFFELSERMSLDGDDARYNKLFDLFNRKHQNKHFIEYVKKTINFDENPDGAALKKPTDIWRCILSCENKQQVDFFFDLDLHFLDGNQGQDFLDMSPDIFNFSLHLKNGGIEKIEKYYQQIKGLQGDGERIGLFQQFLKAIDRRCKQNEPPFEMQNLENWDLKTWLFFFELSVERAGEEKHDEKNAEQEDPQYVQIFDLFNENQENQNFHDKLDKTVACVEGHGDVSKAESMFIWESILNCKDKNQANFFLKMNLDFLDPEDFFHMSPAILNFVSLFENESMQDKVTSYYGHLNDQKIKINQKRRADLFYAFLQAIDRRSKQNNPAFDMGKFENWDLKTWQFFFELSSRISDEEEKIESSRYAQIFDLFNENQGNNPFRDKLDKTVACLEGHGLTSKTDSMMIWESILNCKDKNQAALFFKMNLDFLDGNQGQDFFDMSPAILDFVSLFENQSMQDKVTSYYGYLNDQKIKINQQKRVDLFYAFLQAIDRRSKQNNPAFDMGKFEKWDLKTWQFFFELSSRTPCEEKEDAKYVQIFDLFNGNQGNAQFRDKLLKTMAHVEGAGFVSKTDSMVIWERILNCKDKEEVDFFFKMDLHFLDDEDFFQMSADVFDFLPLFKNNWMTGKAKLYYDKLKSEEPDKEKRIDLFSRFLQAIDRRRKQNKPPFEMQNLENWDLKTWRFFFELSVEGAGEEKHDEKNAKQEDPQYVQIFDLFNENQGKEPFRDKLLKTMAHVEGVGCASKTDPMFIWKCILNCKDKNQAALFLTMNLDFLDGNQGEDFFDMSPAILDFVYLFQQQFMQDKLKLYYQQLKIEQLDKGKRIELFRAFLQAIDRRCKQNNPQFAMRELGNWDLKTWQFFFSLSSEISDEEKEDPSQYARIFDLFNENKGNAHFIHKLNKTIDFAEPHDVASTTASMVIWRHVLKCKDKAQVQSFFDLDLGFLDGNKGQDFFDMSLAILDVALLLKESGITPEIKTYYDEIKHVQCLEEKENLFRQFLHAINRRFKNGGLAKECFKNCDLAAWQSFFELSKEMSDDEQYSEFFDWFNDLFQLSNQEYVEELQKWMDALPVNITPVHKRALIQNIFKRILKEDEVVQQDEKDEKNENPKLFWLKGLKDDEKKIIGQCFVRLAEIQNENAEPDWKKDPVFSQYFSDFSKEAETRVLIMQGMKENIIGNEKFFNGALKLYELELKCLDPTDIANRRRIVSLNEEMASILIIKNRLAKSPQLEDKNNSHLQKKGASIQEIKQKISGYEKSSWKSAERQKQLADLKKGMKEEIEDKMETISFNDMLSVVRGIRNQAMNDDLKSQEARWLYMNRGGGSRFLKMLDEIENLILAYCHDEFSDEKNVLAYQDSLGKEFSIEVSNVFCNVVLSYQRGIFDNSSSEWKHWNYWWKRLFLSDEIKEKHEYFCQKAAAVLNGGLASTEFLEYLKSSDTQEMIKTLPGEVRTVLDEYLLHGNAFFDATQKRKNIAKYK